MARASAPRSRPRSRDDVVAAQYHAPAAAEGYANLHHGSGSAARFFHSRIHLISTVLAATEGGDLLDVGCGPGMMVRELLDSRPGAFRITALDRSPAMVDACARRAAGTDTVRALVGRIEAMPLPDACFDVVLAMGVLEYTDVGAALAEITRVTRPGGLVLVTMLNPASPYRFVEWHIYWPLLRVVGAVETLLSVAPERRHSPVRTGIRAYREGALRRRMVAAGLRPVDAVYFDVTMLVPPIDRLMRRWRRGQQPPPERTISRGWRKRFGTAYLLVARKAPAPADATLQTQE